MTRETSSRPDIYTRVTDKIVADLEQGVRPWIKPWSAEHTAGRIVRPRRHNGLPYNGINILMLWSAAVERGFTAPTWMTYRQANELGAHVCKVEKGAPVVYANTITRTEDTDDGEETERTIPFLKGYTVFNAEQIEGLPDHYYAKPEPRAEGPARIAHADTFFATTGFDIRHGGNRAYYSTTTDYIQMPPFETFKDAESYIATLGHECCHATSHPTRLDRDMGRKRWGDEGYAREELIAELGAAFLCADLDITPEVRDDHAAYLASWLKVLKSDKRAILAAAAHAQRAVDYLHGLQDNGDRER
ncbi:MAG: DUF1738 domain-containing protein [Hyphomicrobiales bacterium]|nr:DUF1738 domain-containing protein [Hyphomicrobiales bacterium]MCP5372031.1 DUF1738 domain-containing protein [Hyphomicrobiales bacterium]